MSAWSDYRAGLLTDTEYSRMCWEEEMRDRDSADDYDEEEENETDDRD